MTISYPIRGLKSLAMILAAGAGLVSLSLRIKAEDMAQVLTRGPVHEAFASAVNYDAKPGIIVSAQIPAAIEEMPPDEQPEGDNVTWIPGYWAWDDDRNNFIWISGVWRNVPPGRQWVPGYWTDIGGGRSQWVSGYWASTEQKEVTYVDKAPPENLDNGPNVEAPSSDHSWIPGYWNWVDTRYVWRPGYWLPLGANWTWVPPYYSWTPCGYAYVSGYWDYAIAGRGVLYAPLCFNGPLYGGVAYSYVPWLTVSLSVFSDHLFYRPYWGHYYFGDYYAPYYSGCGYYASFAWTSGCHGYDPIYCHNRWVHRGNSNWESGLRGDFQYFRDHANARPAHTWTDMQKARIDQFSDGRNRNFASSRIESARQENGTRFRRIDETRRTELASQSREIQKLSQERRVEESRKPDAVANSGRSAQRSLKPSPVRSSQTNPFSTRNVSSLRKSESTTNTTNRIGYRQQRSTGPQAGASAGTNRQKTQRSFDTISRTRSAPTSRSAVPAPRREQSAPARNRAPAQVPRAFTPGASSTRSLPKSSAAPSIRSQQSFNRSSGARASLPSRSSGTRVSPSYSGGRSRVGSTMPSSRGSIGTRQASSSRSDSSHGVSRSSGSNESRNSR